MLVLVASDLMCCGTISLECQEVSNEHSSPVTHWWVTMHQRNMSEPLVAHNAQESGLQKVLPQ